MKIFQRTSLPENIKYNGRLYTIDMELSAYAKVKPGYVPVNKLTTSVIGVFVLSRKLKGKTDIHNKSYEPTKWVYSAKK